MARNNLGIVSFVLHALAGLLVGAVLGALAGFFIEKADSARLQGTVVLFHTPGSGLSDSGRDFVAATLAQTDLLAKLVAEHGWDPDLAAQLSVEAADASRPIAELGLPGNDEAQLTGTLDAIADEMVSLHREKQLARLQWLSSELDTALDDLMQRQRALAATHLDDQLLPPALRTAIADASRLVQERRELELAGRYRLRQGSMLEESNRRRRLDAIATREKRTMPTPGANVDVDPERLENATALANIEAERLALTQTRLRLNDEYEAFKPLQIVRRAEVRPLRVDSALIATLSAAGGVFGLLAGGLIWSGRHAAPKTQSATVLERALRIPVIGVIAELLTEYGERELRPLADDEPLQLTVAGIHSLRVGLHVLAQSSGRSGPEIITETGGYRHGCHLIANLAVIAARAGERVLVIEDTSGDIRISTLLAGVDGAAPFVEPGSAGSLAASDAQSEEGLIRFITYANEPGRAGETGLPVPVTTIQAFDRVLVRVGDAAAGRRLLRAHAGSLGLLLCTGDERPSTLRAIHSKSFHGVGLCGCTVEEGAYTDEMPAVAD